MKDEYTKSMSRRFPGCIIILLDQSGSMTDPFGNDSNAAKMDKAAEAVNSALRDLVYRCQYEDDIVPRCSIGVIGYGGEGVRSAWAGPLHDRTLVPVNEIAHMTTDTRDNGDEVVPIWIEPHGALGTPMAEAFELAAEWLKPWVDAHPECPAPVVINVTDGEPTDAKETLKAANEIRKIRTRDGATLVLNVHLSSEPGSQLILPHQPDVRWSDLEQLMFEISSVLPASLVRAASAHGFSPMVDARGYVFNADAETLVKVLKIGSDYRDPVGRIRSSGDR